MSSARQAPGGPDDRPRPHRLDTLSGSELRITWAVLRSLTTAVWITWVIVVAAWAWMTGTTERFLPGATLLAVTVLVLGAAMELVVRDLQRRVGD